MRAAPAGLEPSAASVYEPLWESAAAAKLALAAPMSAQSDEKHSDETAGGRPAPRSAVGSEPPRRLVPRDAVSAAREPFDGEARAAR